MQAALPAGRCAARQFSAGFQPPPKKAAMRRGNTTPQYILQQPSIHPATVSHPSFPPTRQSLLRAITFPFCCGAPSAWPRRTATLPLRAWGGEKGNRRDRRLSSALVVVAVPVAKHRLPAAAAGGIAAASTQSFNFVSRALWAGSFCLHTMLANGQFATMRLDNGVRSCVGQRKANCPLAHAKSVS